jgi:putative phage-type endonuclease
MAIEPLEQEDLLAAFIGRGVKDRDVWLAARKLGIGGSDAAAALALSPWKTPLALYQEKRGEVEPDDLSDNEFVQWGIILEDVVARHYARKTGRKVRRVNRILKSKAHPFMLCNLDRDIVKSEGGLECKTADARVGERWGEEGTDDVPVPYLIQCHHNIYVADLAWMDLAVLIGGNDFRTYRIPRRDDIIAGLIEKETAFWARVQTEDPPEPINVDDVKRRFRTSTAVTREADEETVTALADYVAAKALAKRNEEIIERLYMKIGQFLGNADTLTHNGKPLLTWKSQNGTRFNGTEHKAFKPDCHLEFTETTSMRVMRVKGEK